MVQADLSKPHAKVYFIRPNTEHAMGFSDNDVAVDIDGTRLMDLTKGEYTLVYLKPRDITVTMTVPAQARGRWEVEDISQSRYFNLEPGQTYYLLASLLDGEFRGARFIPTAVSRYEAQQLVVHLRAAGNAKSRPVL
ncbi:hypothetical protein ACFL2V_20190 [Pseudomonadota bacterium]